MEGNSLYKAEMGLVLSISLGSFYSQDTEFIEMVAKFILSFSQFDQLGTSTLIYLGSLFRISMDDLDLI